MKRFVVLVTYQVIAERSREVVVNADSEADAREWLEDNVSDLMWGNDGGVIADVLVSVSPPHDEAGSVADEGSPLLSADDAVDLFEEPYIGQIDRVE